MLRNKGGEVDDRKLGALQTTPNISLSLVVLCFSIAGNLLLSAGFSTLKISQSHTPVLRSCMNVLLNLNAKSFK